MEGQEAAVLHTHQMRSCLSHLGKLPRGFEETQPATRAAEGNVPLLTTLGPSPSPSQPFDPAAS